MDAEGSSGGIHAAVHLQLTAGVHSVNIAADGLHLGHHVRHELLTAKAGLNGHDEDNVAQLNKGQHGGSGGLGLDHHACFLTLGADKTQSFEGVLLGIGLHMAGDDIGACIAELLHVAHGTVDHQMDIQGKGRGGAQGLHHRDADGDVGDEETVHHVHMDIVGGGDFLNVALEVGKVSREDRRCDLNHNVTPFSCRTRDCGASYNRCEGCTAGSVFSDRGSAGGVLADPHCVPVLLYQCRCINAIGGAKFVQFVNFLYSPFTFGRNWDKMYNRKAAGRGLPA